jgi:transcriptional regulator with XRE-family HTH domain
MAVRIRELRVRNNIKQSELAKSLGISQATLSNWERGEFEPDKNSLIKLAEIFDTTIDFVLGRTSHAISYNANNIHDSNFVQGDGCLDVNVARQLSPEEKELLRIYGALDVKGRHELLERVFDLERRR